MVLGSWDGCEGAEGFPGIGASWWNHSPCRSIEMLHDTPELESRPDVQLSGTHLTLLFRHRNPFR